MRSRLSASDDDEEDHNTWNVLLDLITSFDFGARIQLILADEELGRVGLNCHYAMDCLCAEVDHVNHCFGLLRRVQLQRQLSFLMRKRRALLLKTAKMSIPCQLHLHPCHWLPTPTRHARMTRRPVSECRDDTTCLRSNVPTGHKVSPDPTRQKARYHEWNCSEQTDVSQPETCDEQTQPKATVTEQPRTHQSEHHMAPFRDQKRQQ